MRRGVALLPAALLGISPAFAADVGKVNAGNDARLFAAFSQRIDATKAAIMGDPAKALQLADDALATAQKLPASRRARVAVATAQWLDGEAHIFLNETDRAAPIIAAALATANAYAPNTKLQGDLLRSRGAIAATQGQVQQALASYQQAYRVFVAAHEPRSQAIELQDIGATFEDAGDYARALRYYEQASDTYTADPALLVANYNNRAEVLRKLKRLPEAETQYRAALGQARLLGGAVLEVRILCNLADVEAERGELAAARAAVDRASALSGSGEAAGWRPFVFGTAAKVALAGHNAREAAGLFDRMFADVDLKNTDMPYREFHQAASDAYAQLGRADLALAHLRAFERLNDSARDLTASTSAQLASARFDFTNQNLRISTLKAQQLQQEVQLEHQRARLRSIIIGAGLAIALAVFGFLSFALVSGRRSRDRLRHVNSDLQRALKAKTEFLAMTSHEIRTPLNGILGMTQVMLSDRDLRADVRDRLRVVHGAGETMRALVDDILDVAKMETSTVAIVDEDVDVVAMIGEVALLWSAQAHAKGVDLFVVSDGLPPLLQVDPARLRQIVFNLLSNAVKFTAAGRINVVSRQVGDRLVISVSDTGIGIDPVHHEIIFEPFQQADASTTRQFGGTGLGLAICRKLAQAMGGDIDVESALRAGAVFTLTLPLVVSAASGTVLGVQPHTAELAGARLLLIDRNMISHGMFGALLEPHVLSYSAVMGEAEAWPALTSRRVDHLLIDALTVTGADGSGTDILRSLISQAMTAGVRVSVLAAAASPVPLEDLASAGADQFILKPIAGSALVARLQELYTDRHAIAA